MKKILMFIALILICFGIKAQSEKADICYVKTGDHVYFGQDLKIGIIQTRIILADGTVEKVKNRDVKAFMHDGKLYELMPVICAKHDTVCLALMEFIASKSGMKLYRYYCTRDENNPRYIYFVFKDGKFYSRVEDAESAKEVLPKFGIKVKVQNLGLAFN